MAFAVGLRFYRISVRRKGTNDPLEIGPGCDPCDLIEYIENFIERKTDPTNEGDALRTWFFDPKVTESIRTIHGYISYGTHGFESRLKDVKTKQPKYDRKATDLEEIPLYFQFWAPNDAKHALAAFQSFQGRSCVTFVRAAMIADFQRKYPAYTLAFSIVAPASAIADAAPVKSVTFVKPKRVGDRADRPWLGKSMEEIDYELTIRARRRGGMISTFKELGGLLATNAEGMVVFDGSTYEGARADVKVGDKRRVIGILGSGGDAGLIDVTENVKSDKSGHPVFSSIAGEVDALMETFYEGIKA